MEAAMNFVVSKVITIPDIKIPFEDLKHPKKAYSIERAMNLYINLNHEQYIGAWFMQPFKDHLDGLDGQFLPKSEDEQYIPPTLFNISDPPMASSSSRRTPLVGKNETIMLYLHGISETRAAWYRREMYRVFQKMGCYVLAIDYRCYGDSFKLNCPTQTSFVEDALAAFEWIESIAHPEANIFIWGHSLGTGVSSKLGQILSTNELRIKPKGYILEAPFNCMKDEVATFKSFKILTFIGGITGLGATAENLLEQADMLFDNGVWIPHIEQPVMILHAKDDEIIPFDLAEKLFNHVKEKKANVEFVPFNSNLKLGHNRIFKALAQFDGIVLNFIQKALK